MSNKLRAAFFLIVSGGAGGCAGSPATDGGSTAHWEVVAVSAKNQFVFSAEARVTPKTPVLTASRLVVRKENDPLAPTSGAAANTPTPPSSQPLSVHFDDAEAIVDVHDAKRIVEAVGSRAISPKERIVVTGFTDSTAAPSASISNREVAMARARAVRDVLVNAGVDPGQIVIHGRPTCCYVASNASEEGRRANRRAEIAIVRTNDRSTLP